MRHHLYAKQFTFCLVFLLLISFGSLKAETLRLTFVSIQLTPEKQLEQMTLSSSDKVYYVGKDQIEIYDSEITGVYVSRDPMSNGFQTEIDFTKSGAYKVLQFTSERIREEIGIVVNSKLIYVATVAEPLSDEVIISGTKDEKAAKDIASIISDGIIYESKDKPVKHNVFIGIESKDSFTISRDNSLVIVRPEKSDAELNRAINLFSDLMNIQKYKIVAQQNINKDNIEETLWMAIQLKNMNLDRMSLVIQVFKINTDRTIGKTDSAKYSILWSGIFGVETAYYLSDSKHIIDRIIGLLEITNTRDEQTW